MYPVKSTSVEKYSKQNQRSTNIYISVNYRKIELMREDFMMEKQIKSKCRGR